MAKSAKALSADLADAFAADSGVGFEEVTSSDLQIPFLRIIQALSPQLKRMTLRILRVQGRRYL